LLLSHLLQQPVSDYSLHLLSGFFYGYLFCRLAFGFFFCAFFGFLLVFVGEIFFKPLLAVDAGGGDGVAVDHNVGDVIHFELGVAQVDAGGLQGVWDLACCIVTSRRRKVPPRASALVRMTSKVAYALEQKPHPSASLRAGFLAHNTREKLGHPVVTGSC
jgi:hypothetical protein